jgi:hypothetical protein
MIFELIIYINLRNVLRKIHKISNLLTYFKKTLATDLWTGVFSHGSAPTIY